MDRPNERAPAPLAGERNVFRRRLTLTWSRKTYPGRAERMAIEVSRQHYATGTAALMAAQFGSAYEN
jgi:hypothetical protein